MFAVVIAICSWISIPTIVPFTLQTLGVFCAVGLLGGKRGTLAVLIYIMLGALGLPVFAGFLGGFGVIMGPTGGYIIGFIGSALVYWLTTELLGTKTRSTVLAMLLGLLVCYIFGTAWFMAVYSGSSGAIGLSTALGWCVIPFIIPDLIKIAFAVFIVKTVRRHVKTLG